MWQSDECKHQNGAQSSDEILKSLPPQDSPIHTHIQERLFTLSVDTVTRTLGILTSDILTTHQYTWIHLIN